MYIYKCAHQNSRYCEKTIWSCTDANSLGGAQRQRRGLLPKQPLGKVGSALFMMESPAKNKYFKKIFTTATKSIESLNLRQEEKAHYIKTVGTKVPVLTMLRQARRHNHCFMGRPS